MHSGLETQFLLTVFIKVNKEKTFSALCESPSTLDLLKLSGSPDPVRATDTVTNNHLDPDRTVVCSWFLTKS